MAKILSVDMESVPEFINVGDDINDLTVLVNIEFHPLDILMKMEYQLCVFIYDIHGEVDVPVIIGNWDDSYILGVAQSSKDDFLGKKIVLITANEKGNSEIKIPIALKLGNLTKKSSSHSRKLEVFATMIPAVGRVSKWSEPFESHLYF